MSQSGPLSRFHRRLREQIDCALNGRGRRWSDASQRERLGAVASGVHRVALDIMRDCEERYREDNAKRLYFLSMEYLMGRALSNNLHNLEIYDDAKAVVDELGQDDLETLATLEPDAALGNGAIGRWAACLLDSLATHRYAGFGYGINYEFGLFRQSFIHGFQHERPDQWLDAAGSPWLIERSDEAVIVPVYGNIVHTTERGIYIPKWMDARIIIGVPHDMPIVGYGGRNVNTLRLFSARSSDDFDIGIFNAGDYIRAVQHKISTEAISKILDPSDVIDRGRELRLLQEYFLIACAVQDILRRHRERYDSFMDLTQHIAIHLNGADPALAIAELMRVLVDQERISWDSAWALTVGTCSYTNHNRAPELTQAWPVDLIEHVLPRHLQIIIEIDRRQKLEVHRRFGEEESVLGAAAIVRDGNVRMRQLATAGSHRCIAAFSSSADQAELALSRLYPGRFGSILNGITPRRWLLHANRPLASMITNTIGDAWVTDLDSLEELELFSNNDTVLAELMTIKHRNKLMLARLTKELTGIQIDPASLFDVHAAPFQEHKRHLLTLLWVIGRYWSIIEDGVKPQVPRAIVFAGKAAPGAFMAKLVIKMVHSVAAVVNADPRSREWLRVAFLPDYRVTLAEHIMPGAELSEHLSSPVIATTETGCLKAALNGALMITTRHGIARELCRVFGESNIFMFDGDIEGTYQPDAIVQSEPESRRVLNSLESGYFCRGDRDLVSPLIKRLLSPGDNQRSVGHLRSYMARQKDIDSEWMDQRAWAQKSLLNIARMGQFSCDRTIHEYAQKVWHLSPSTGARLAKERD